MRFYKSVIVPYSTGVFNNNIQVWYTHKLSTSTCTNSSKHVCTRFTVTNFTVIKLKFWSKRPSGSDQYVLHLLKAL